MANNARTAAIAAGLPLFVALVFLTWYSLQKPHTDMRSISLAGDTIYVTVADTEESRELGLGNRASLRADEGMLFVFANDGKFSFWMKDMKFSIDMLWLSEDGTVVYIQPNVSPDTYPQTFAPSQPARYVLELQALFSQKHGIKVGDKVSL